MADDQDIADRIEREVRGTATADDLERSEHPVADDDRVRSDKTARDLAAEREAPPPAEGTALHKFEDP